MKKLSVLVTALLCCSLAYSQEVDVRIIPRVDVNTYVPINKDGGAAVDFGNTSFYSLVEGTFLENFSYSIENHWISVYGYETPGQDIAGLYTNTLNSNAGNWLDWANLTYTLYTDNAGSFSITGGKDVLSISTFEYDAYDFDAHFGLNSMLWNYLPAYQWGGKIAYTTPNEANTVSFQAATSPFGGRLFKERQYGAYSLQYRGDYEVYSPMVGVNFIEYEPNKYLQILSLGQQAYFGDFTIGLDWMNRVSTAKTFFGQEMQLMGNFSYNFDDKFELFGKVGWERFKAPVIFTPADDIFGIFEDYGYELSEQDPVLAVPTNYIFGGLGLNWYPLKDSQDLRVHAVISANNWVNEMSINLGVTYNFSVFSR